MLKKILLLPGWMTNLILYKAHDDLDIQIGKLKNSPETEYIVGLSLGALIALLEWNKSGKLILVNPPLPKRNILIWFRKWVKYILTEGLFLKRQKFINNPFKYTVEIIECIKLLKIDSSKVLDNMPKDKVVVVRGKKDEFFCDSKAVEFLRTKNIQLIEIENYGHNWCKEIESVVCKLTNYFLLS